MPDVHPMEFRPEVKSFPEPYFLGVLQSRQHLGGLPPNNDAYLNTLSKERRQEFASFASGNGFPGGRLSP